MEVYSLEVEKLRAELARHLSEGRTKDGDPYVDIHVCVRVEQPEEKLAYEGGELIFYTTEPPLQGRANAALMRYLARLFGVRANQVDIVWGVRDKCKRVRVYRVTLDEALDRLVEHLAGGG